MNEVVKKNVLIAVAVFLALAALLALGWWVKQSLAFSSFEDRKEGFALKYPSGWQVTANPQPNVIAVFVSPKENALDTFLENINLSKTDLSAEPLTIEQYAETVPKQMTAAFADIVVEEKSLMNISRHKAVKFVFHAQGPPDMFIVVYAFIDHDIAYNITYMGAAERYPSDKPLIGGLVTSIKTYF